METMCVGDVGAAVSIELSSGFPNTARTISLPPLRAIPVTRMAKPPVGC